MLAGLRSDSPPLDRRLCGSDACWERPLAVASITYGYVQELGDGPWRVGDQAAVIPSFAGDGISIALHSARLAAEYYLAGKPTRLFQSQLARDVSGQVRWATLLSRVLVCLAWRDHRDRSGAKMAPSLIGQVARRTQNPESRPC